jgi:hypothetical protein
MLYHSILLNILLLIIILYLLLNDKKNTYIKTSKYGGELSRGVFANINFNKGDIIEEGHTIISADDNTILNCGVYKHYIYSRTDSDGNALLLGDGCLYNHSLTKSNAYVRTNGDKFKVIAKKNINKDEEIFICYGCNHPNSKQHYDYGKDHQVNLID